MSAFRIRNFAWLLLICSGCSYFAIKSAPKKIADPSQTELAQKATRLFWDNFHAGNYDQLPQVIEILTAAYLENPRDPKVALLLAHSHFWKLAERTRAVPLKPGITDHLILARKYFEEAQALNPKDYRIHGWIGATKLAMGKIDQNEKLTREGYFLLHQAIDLFPEFNYFAAGYPLSSLPREDKKFEESVEDMWKNLEVCSDDKIDRDDPDYSRYMAQETTQGVKRVCWNSWIAPHNFEGFFLNMGDMLVKKGEVQRAKKIYENAKLSKDFETWHYKPLLEKRIAQAAERAALFKTAKLDQQPEILLNSPYACVACHQKKH